MSSRLFHIKKNAFLKSEVSWCYSDWSLVYLLLIFFRVWHIHLLHYIIFGFMRCNQIFYFCSFYKKFLCSENLPWSLTWVDPIHFFIKLILKNLSLCSAPNMELGFLLHVYLVPWDILISFDCNCLFTWLCFIFLTCRFSFINNKILRGRILAKIFLSSTTKLLLSFFSLGLLFFFFF